MNNPPYTILEGAYTHAEISQLTADAKEAGRRTGLLEAMHIASAISLAATGTGLLGPVADANEAISAKALQASTVPVPSGFDQGAKEAFDAVEKTLAELLVHSALDGNDIRRQALADALESVICDQVQLLGLKERVGA